MARRLAKRMIAVILRLRRSEDPSSHLADPMRRLRESFSELEGSLNRGQAPLMRTKRRWVPLTGSLRLRLRSSSQTKEPSSPEKDSLRCRKEASPRIEES